MLPDQFIGRQIGDYTIEARIGRGGMATVYRAYQPSVNRHVALKIIYPDVTNEAEYETFQRRFAREAEVIARLEHLHILPIYEYGIEDGVAYLAMRLLNGGSLSDMLNQGRLPLERTADIFGQIAQGLAHAHSKGVVHRDLKPSNIMLDEVGNAYLTDFGLAKWLEQSQDLTKSGNIVGTPAYMAPEHLKGETIDHRADIYSMGIVLYHMIVGHPPFDTSTTDIISIIYQHLEKEPTPPSQLVDGVPPAAEAVVMRALQKDPAERYSDIRQMAYELDLALGRPTSIHKYGSNPFIPEPIPSVIIRRVSGRQGRRQLYAALAAGLALVALAAALLLFSQGRTAVVSIMPEVLDGQQGAAEQHRPTEAEIATARQALGDNGFIAYITCNQTSEYHATQAREMGDFARAYGLNYRVYDSDTDEYRQLTQIERARTDGAKALIICPLNAQLLDNPLRAIDAANMPLVLLSANLPSYYGGVALISASTEHETGFRVGELAGRIISEELGGQADVIILDYPELPAIVERANGLQNGILSTAPQANIIGRYLGATRDNGRDSVERLLEEGVGFNVIASINDAGSFGAIDALREAGIQPDEVIIASIDAEQQALRYIADGYFIRVSFDPGREPNSRAAIDVVVKLLAGSPIPEKVLVPQGDLYTADMLMIGR